MRPSSPSVPPVARLAWLALFAGLSAAGVAGAEPVEILVKLRAQGPHAVEACAQTLHRRGEGLAGATRDGSDSLDRLHAAHGVRQVRAVFRRPDGRPFAAQRRALRARAELRRQARSREARAVLPPIPELAHVYRLRLAPGTDSAAAAARYAADPHVVWAQPNFAASLDLVADDPFLASSGSWGQPFADLWGIHRVGAPAAWDHSQGEGVVIAVVDTGVDTEHPDLAANLWVNPGEDLDGDGRAEPEDRNGLDDDGNGFIDDLHGFDFANSVDADGDGDFDDPDDVSDADPFDDFGHGTHVAGTAAAVADNGIGIAGVAPRARIMALKGFGATGGAPIERLVRAMFYAIENGARVINNSWSCTTRCPRNRLAEEAAAFAAASGVVVVTSAGNRQDDVVFFSPENRPDTITVGASDENDRPAAFTNSGFLIDVMAPGGGDPRGPGHFAERAILSARSAGASFAADGGGAFVVGEEYLRWAGTSMSAPHVAGIAALILGARPGLDVDAVRGLLRQTARDLGVPGHDRVHGAGLADALAALRAEPPAVAARFEAPRPGAILVPGDGPVAIRGALGGDLVEAELAFGFGSDPGAFEPIPLEARGDGTLAHWEVAELADGPYLLRLEVVGRDGGRVVEFLPVSLERNPPTRLSSPGARALAPAVSGTRVAWESRRGIDGVALGSEIFVHEWRSGAEWRAVSGPGDQHGARLSGRRLAWLDTDEESEAVATCHVTGAARPCRARPAAQGGDRYTSLALSGERLVWVERVDGDDRLGGCLARGAGCRRLQLPDSDARQTAPALDGARLAWQDWSRGAAELLTCVGFPERCEPVPVDLPLSPDVFAVSEDRLAWVPLLAADPLPLFVCSLGDDGACESIRVGDLGLDRGLALSGHRVVWSGPGPGGDSDVFLCEHDPLTASCPVQRLTGSAADQRNPDVSGARVVWEDDREGTPAVFGLELPSLDPVPSRRVKVGQPLHLAVRGHDPSGAGLSLAARFADGAPLASRGAQFETRPNGSGVLRWTPSAAALGEHVVTFEARAAGGLVARRSARIEVVKRSGGAPPRAGSRRPRPRPPGGARPSDR